LMYLPVTDCPWPLLQPPVTVYAPMKASVDGVPDKSMTCPFSGCERI
jgi:hypothetical protein